MLAGFAFLVLVLAAPMHGALQDHMLVKAAAIEVYIFGLSIAFLIWFNDGVIAWARELLSIVLVVLIAWGMLGLAWGTNPDYGTVILFKWLTGALLAVLVFQLRSHDRQMVFMDYLFAAGVIVAVLGIFQYLFGLSAFTQSKPPAATFANRNMAGQIIVLTWLAGPLLLVLRCRRGDPRQYYYCLGTVFALAFAFYTGSRAVWLAIALQVFAVGVLLIASLRGERRLLRARQFNPAALAVSGLVLAILLNVNGAGFAPVWQTGAARVADFNSEATQVEGHTTYKRFILWKSALRMIRDAPLLGRGLGGYEASQQRYAWGDTVYSPHAHNDYLQYTVDLGAGFVVIVLVVGFLLITQAIDLLRHTDQPHVLERYCMLTLSGGIAVVAAFSFPFQLIGPIVLMGGIIGLYLQLRAAAEDRVSAFQLGQRGQRIALVVLVPMFALIFYCNYQWQARLAALDKAVAAPRSHTIPNLETLVEHPTFRRLVWYVTNQHKSTHPAKAERIARAYNRINDHDVVVLDALALTAVLQKRYDEGARYIESARRLEPPGDNSSWVTEMVMYSQQNDMTRLQQVLQTLEKKPKAELTAQRYTLVAMALAAYQTGDPGHAISLLLENIRDYPDYRPSWERLLQMLVQQHDYASAREYLEKFEARFGRDKRSRALHQLLRDK